MAPVLSDTHLWLRAAAAHTLNTHLLTATCPVWACGVCVCVGACMCVCVGACGMGLPLRLNICGFQEILHSDVHWKNHNDTLPMSHRDANIGLHLNMLCSDLN